MCCRCCTSLKVAGVWGSSIQMALGTILLLQFFVLPERLDEYYYFYLTYVSVLLPLGALILLAVLKGSLGKTMLSFGCFEGNIFVEEIGWLLKITSSLFVILQVYGLSIRLMLPMESMETFRMLRRILTLFFAIVFTAIYSFILILYSRKVCRAAALAAQDDGGVEAGSVADGDGGSVAATAL